MFLDTGSEFVRRSDFGHCPMKEKRKERLSHNDIRLFIERPTGNHLSIKYRLSNSSSFGVSNIVGELLPAIFGSNVKQDHRRIRLLANSSALFVNHETVHVYSPTRVPHPLI